MEFEVGKKYTGKDTKGNSIIIRIKNKYQSHYGVGYDYTTILDETQDDSSYDNHFLSDSHFAKSLKPYEDLPRICRVLGGEDTPLKIGEKFQIKGYEDSKFWVERDGLVRFLSLDNHTVTASDSVQNAINHPEKIIRPLQFTEDEEAFMREYVKAGYPVFERINSDDCLVAWEKEGIKGINLPKGILPQITGRFNAETYLESEDK